MIMHNRPGILLIDHRPRLVVRAFDASGIDARLEVARDAVQGFALLSGGAGGPAPSLVVLDWHLPVIDGLEVLSMMRSTEAWRALPVVVLSSADHQQADAACRRLGAARRLARPQDWRGHLVLARALRWHLESGGLLRGPGPRAVLDSGRAW